MPDIRLTDISLSSCGSATLIDERVQNLVTTCFSDPNWLSAFEAYAGLDMAPCHHIATRNGTPIAFLPAYIKSEGMCGTLRDRLFGRLSDTPVFRNWGRQNALVCSSPWGFYSGIECRHEDRSNAFAALIDHMDRVAREKRLGLTGFTFVPESSRKLREQLRLHGYRALPVGPTALLELKWDSFDEYVAGFASGNIRRAIRRERKRSKRLSVEWVEDDSLEKQYFGRPLYKILMGLYNNTHHKHYGGKSILDESFLPKLWQADKRNLRLCIAVLNRSIVAFGLLRVFGDNAHAFMLGRDYSMADDFGAYFNVAYYEPVVRGISEGWRTIDYQPGVLHAKIRRGCRLENLYLHVKGHNRPARAFLGVYIPVAGIYFRRKLDRLSRPGE